MRRLAALAVTMALAWLLVERLGSEPAGSAALALGVALIAASIVGWLFEFARLPRVTGYLAFGLLCGPSVANIITDVMARDLRAASGFAIALIAFTAGLQLQIDRFRPTFRALLTMSIVTTVGETPRRTLDASAAAAARRRPPSSEPIGSHGHAT